MSDMLSLQKQKADRDEDYKAFIRSRPCLKCGAPPLSCAHHQPDPGHSSTALKTSDYKCVPLCSECHRRYHSIGRHSFWGDADVERAILSLNITYFFAHDVAHIS